VQFLSRFVGTLVSGEWWRGAATGVIGRRLCVDRLRAGNFNASNARERLGLTAAFGLGYGHHARNELYVAAAGGAVARPMNILNLTWGVGAMAARVNRQALRKTRCQRS